MSLFFGLGNFGVGADQMHHHTGQHQSLLFGSAAGKLNAVTETCVVQNHLVSLLRGTVVHQSDPGILLLQPLQLAVDLFTGDNMTGIGGLQTTVNKAYVYFSSFTR